MKITKIEDRNIKIDIKSLLMIINIIVTIIGFGVLIGMYISKINKIDEIEDDLKSITSDYNILKGKLLGARLIAFNNDTLLNDSSLIDGFPYQLYDIYYKPIYTYAGNNDIIYKGLQEPSSYAITINKKICNALHIAYINIYRGDVPNACAAIIDQYDSLTTRKIPIIVYNREFMGVLHNINKWAPIGVVAHEIGHHFNGDLNNYRFNYAISNLTNSQKLKDNWNKELAADYVSGWALNKLGASLSDAVSTWSNIIKIDSSYSHPNSDFRIDAIKLGWYAAQKD